MAAVKAGTGGAGNSNRASLELDSRHGWEGENIKWLFG